MKFDAVAFDVDGTLYPNLSMYLLSIPTFITNFKLIHTLDLVRAELRQNPDNSQDFHHAQAEKLAEKLKLTPQKAYALVEGHIYTLWFRIFRRIKPYPNLKDCLESFHNSGLKLAVMSDFPIRERLKNLGLNQYWDCAFSSEETGYLKPHPWPFQVLAQKLKIPAERILYVGNSYRYDVLGALAAGMPCAHIGKKKSGKDSAVFTFRNYKQLKDFVLNS